MFTILLHFFIQKSCMSDGMEEVSFEIEDLLRDITTFNNEQSELEKLKGLIEENVFPITGFVPFMVDEPIVFGTDTRGKLYSAVFTIHSNETIEYQTAVYDEKQRRLRLLLFKVSAKSTKYRLHLEEAEKVESNCFGVLTAKGSYSQATVDKLCAGNRACVLEDRVECLVNRKFEVTKHRSKLGKELPEIEFEVWEDEKLLEVQTVSLSGGRSVPGFTLLAMGAKVAYLANNYWAAGNEQTAFGMDGNVLLRKTNSASSFVDELDSDNLFLTEDDLAATLLLEKDQTEHRFCSAQRNLRLVRLCDSFEKTAIGAPLVLAEVLRGFDFKLAFEVSFRAVSLHRVREEVAAHIERVAVQSARLGVVEVAVHVASSAERAACYYLSVENETFHRALTRFAVFRLDAANNYRRILRFYFGGVSRARLCFRLYDAAETFLDSAKKTVQMTVETPNEMRAFNKVYTLYSERTVVDNKLHELGHNMFRSVLRILFVFADTAFLFVIIYFRLFTG